MDIEVGSVWRSELSDYRVDAVTPETVTATPLRMERYPKGVGRQRVFKRKTFEGWIACYMWRGPTT